MLRAAPPCRPVLGGEGGSGSSPVPCCCHANPIPTLPHPVECPGSLACSGRFSSLSRRWRRVTAITSLMGSGEGKWKGPHFPFSEENFPPGPQRQALGMSWGWSCRGMALQRVEIHLISPGSITRQCSAPGSWLHSPPNCSLTSSKRK